jgi:hypothetical protein
MFNTKRKRERENCETPSLILPFFSPSLSCAFLDIQQVSKVQALQRGRRGRRRAGEAVEERKRLQASVTVSRMIVGYHGRRYDTKYTLYSFYTWFFI